MAETKTENKAVETKTAKKKTVTIKLPLTRTEKEPVWVGINGESWLIKRGVDVEVPASVAEVLEHREEMLAAAMDFEESAKERAN